MHGVRLTVAYDGTDFSGYAAQPGLRTVQGELERAVAEMAGHSVTVRGASRTDRGVHARGQVVAFDAARAIPTDGWRDGLNGHLPPDLAVRDAVAVAAGYEPRFDALRKWYRYQILRAPTRDPLLRRTSWHVDRPLDVARMGEAAAAWIGTHDFRALKAADDERVNTVRTIESITLRPLADEPALLAVDVRGHAFMKQMVRILVGTLVEIGWGRRDSSTARAVLEPGATRAVAGRTAPPQGLTLMEIELGRAGS